MPRGSPIELPPGSSHGGTGRDTARQGHCPPTPTHGCEDRCEDRCEAGGEGIWEPFRRGMDVRTTKVGDGARVGDEGTQEASCGSFGGPSVPGRVRRGWKRKETSARRQRRNGRRRRPRDEVSRRTAVRGLRGGAPSHVVTRGQTRTRASRRTHADSMALCAVPRRTIPSTCVASLGNKTDAASLLPSNKVPLRVRDVLLHVSSPEHGASPSPEVIITSSR